MKLLEPSLRRTETPDGFVLEPTCPLPEPAPTVLAWLDRHARERPDAPFLAERDGETWSTLTYGRAHAEMASVASLLAERGAGPGAPVVLLSDASIAHAVVMLAALHLGAPVVPVSQAYSTLSGTFGRLRHIVELVAPGVVFAEAAGPFAAALDAVGLGDRMLTASDVRAAATRAPVERADIGPDTIAKILFTSGSTGDPRGVVNTHRMWSANQESLRASWPFVADEPPVVVDWLPWSHTFGGNHNLGLVLRNGGTMTIDRGRPAPGLLDTTLRNLADVGPTLWFNVPRGFDMAVGALEADPGLARAVFRNLRVLFYAAAALGRDTWDRLQVVARAAGNPDVLFTSAWGSTETSPLATSAHFPTSAPGVLGVPVPGVALKLARVEDRYELRVKGPNVTPGYWQRGGAITPPSLDDDGFLRTGDAGRLVDEDQPEAGVAFVGRLSENFKLSSGTWVNVATVRLGLVDACAPWLQDAVIAGHDRARLGALLVPSPAGAALPPAELEARLAAGVDAWNEAHGSSSERVAHVAITGPLSLDAGETTDKGYTNQRRVLENRADEVARLFLTARR